MTKYSSTSSPPAKSFFQRAIEMVKRIPDGKVSTYGQISKLMSGSVRGARAVGYALAGLSEEEAQVIPWWRVINAQGRISNSRREHRAIIQRQLLEEEGIEFDKDERIDLSSFGWQGTGGDAERKREKTRSGRGRRRGAEEGGDAERKREKTRSGRGRRRGAEEGEDAERKREKRDKRLIKKTSFFPLLFPFFPFFPFFLLLFPFFSVQPPTYGCAR